MSNTVFTLYFMLFRLVRETNIQEIIPFANPLLPKKKHGETKLLPKVVRNTCTRNKVLHANPYRLSSTNINEKRRKIRQVPHSSTPSATSYPRVIPSETK